MYQPADPTKLQPGGSRTLPPCVTSFQAGRAPLPNHATNETTPPITRAHKLQGRERT
jgi:hypothetical protein